MTGISPSAMPGGNAEELRDRAAAYDAKAAESFDRCDTDGFVSQWADGIMGEVNRLAAEIADNNGLYRFPALYDSTGTLVDAQEIENRYGGWSWKITGPDGAVSWFNESKNRDWRKRLTADARKGFFVGSVLLPARATSGGGGKGLAGACNVRAVAVRLHDDYRGYVILDNGSHTVSEDTIRAEYVRTISRHEERSDPDGVRARVINEQLYRVDLFARAENGR